MILRIRKRFPIRNLMLWIAMMCVFSYALLEHVSIPIPAFSAVKRPLLYVGGLCILMQTDVLLKNILKKRYFYVALVLLILCMALALSMMINEGSFAGASPKGGTSRLMLFLVELFALMILLAEASWKWRVVQFLYGYLLVLVILTDILILTGGVRFISGIYEYYLVGTKFSVIYIHMNLIAFGLIKRMKDRNTAKIPRWLICGAAAILVCVSVRVDCMTGVLGAAMLVVLYWRQNEARPEKARVLTSQGIFLMCLLGCFVFPFVVEDITKYSFVKYLVQNVLGRNMDLTGRLNIYQDFVDKMWGHWLLGFGYGSANAVSAKLFGYANTQNALLNLILQCGILGTSLLVTLLTVVVREKNRCEIERVTCIRPLLVLIYVYIFIGTVETTFNMSFILWFAVLFMWVNSQENE